MKKMTYVVENTTQAVEEMWQRITEGADSRPTILICDIDGTLVETDPELCQMVASLPEKEENISLMIATGRTLNERQNSSKFEGKESLGKYSPIMICQGGSLVYNKRASVEEYYVIPIQQDMLNLVKDIAYFMDMTVCELFRGEHLCMHYFDTSTAKEVVAIPIAKEDEADVKVAIAPYNGNIVAAVKAGALNHYDIAVKEYLERGKPESEIGVLFESEIPEKLYTELTIVNHDLTKLKSELLSEYGLEIRIQKQIADRFAGTRGCKQNIKPDISDIVEIGKKTHIDALIKCVKELGGKTIGFGDQYNDDHLYSTDYSVVADAAPILVIDQIEKWSFAIDMAQRAKGYQEEGGPKVIHAAHGSDGNILNYVVKDVIRADGFEKRVELLDSMAESKTNLEKRSFLMSFVFDDKIQTL